MRAASETEARERARQHSLDVELAECLGELVETARRVSLDVGLATGIEGLREADLQRISVAANCERAAIRDKLATGEALLAEIDRLERQLSLIETDLARLRLAAEEDRQLIGEARERQAREEAARDARLGRSTAIVAELKPYLTAAGLTCEDAERDPRGMMARLETLAAEFERSDT
ncbi:MAG TPA: hypothetical protein PK264_08300, partial [Hyphomicrobiaceae bacterium]|nr:hypothetical protein [Hyphomicrobiaceae bacterium]